MLARLRAACTARSARCGLYGSACSLALVLAAGGALARAAVSGEEQVSSSDACSSVTFSYSHFPQAPTKAREIVTVDGQHVVQSEFSFDATEASSTVSVHVPPGHHSMDAHASWVTNGEHGDRDMKLSGGITCAAEPGLQLEKLQRTTDGSPAFTTLPVSGWPGEAIVYAIVATNTGNVDLALSRFEDPHCDVGSLSGGPGAGALAPGASTTYRCEHALTASDLEAGEYANTARVTADWSEAGSGELTEWSNTVVADVTEAPPAPPPPPAGQGQDPPPPPGASAPGPAAGVAELAGVLSFTGLATGPRCAPALVASHLAVSAAGRASLRLLLAGKGGCAGRLRMTVRRRVARGRARAVVIASGSFSAPAGRTVTVALALDRLGRALLRAAHGRLGATLALTRTVPGSAATHTVAVHLVAARARRQS